MPTVRAHSLVAFVAVSILVGAGLAGCSSNGNSGKTIDVSLVEYRVLPAVTSVAAGDVTFKVKNNGSFIHELVVDKAADVAALPTKPDGEVDEDKIPAAAHLGEVEDIDPGKTKSLKVTLTAGSYVLFCNRVDGTTSHFKQGMHVAFTVTPS